MVVSKTGAVLLFVNVVVVGIVVVVVGDDGGGGGGVVVASLVVCLNSCDPRLSGSYGASNVGAGCCPFPSFGRQGRVFGRRISSHPQSLHQIQCRCPKRPQWRFKSV